LGRRTGAFFDRIAVIPARAWIYTMCDFKRATFLLKTELLTLSVNNGEMRVQESKRVPFLEERITEPFYAVMVRMGIPRGTLRFPLRWS